MCVLETTAKHLMRFGTTAVLPSISWISIPTSRLFSLNSDITSGFFSQSRPLLSIPLGLSREKFWRQKLFLCLVQIEINLIALLSFCTKPEKVSFAKFFPETNQVESTIRRRERRFFQIFSYAKNTLLSIPLGS